MEQGKRKIILKQILFSSASGNQEMECSEIYISGYKQLNQTNRKYRRE
jgi:hypothetical protein